MVLNDYPVKVERKENGYDHAVIKIPDCEIEPEDVGNLIQYLLTGLIEAVVHNTQQLKAHEESEHLKSIAGEPITNLRWKRSNTGDYTAHAPSGTLVRVWLDGDWHAQIGNKKVGTFGKKREAQVMIESALAAFESPIQ